MAAEPLRLLLYTSAGCCLCDTLHAQLDGLRAEIPFELEVVDITGDPELEAEYRAELPVLRVNGRKAVKYRISTPALRQRLQRAAFPSPLGGWLDMLRLR